MSSSGEVEDDPALAWLDARLPELSSRVSSVKHPRREYAAAALVRCRNLYEAIVVLRRNGCCLSRTFLTVFSG